MLSKLSAAVATLIALGPALVCATPPVNYGLVLFPAFSPVDAFGPLDYLDLLAVTKGTVNLSIIASSPEPVNTRLVSMDKFGSTMNQSIVATHTFANPPKDLDVLIVPGGAGTRAPAPALLDAIEYIKDVYPSLKYIISVCTGATLLARAGILDGKRATSNKKAWPFVTSSGPDVKWVAPARWVVDGNIWTISGGTAGLDGFLGFLEHVYDAETAQWVADMEEYAWHNDSTWDPYSQVWNVTATGQ